MDLAYSLKTNIFLPNFTTRTTKAPTLPASVGVKKPLKRPGALSENDNDPKSLPGGISFYPSSISFAFGAIEG